MKFIEEPVSEVPMLGTRGMSADGGRLVSTGR